MSNVKASTTRVKPKHVIAFVTDPGEDCEAANFGLACIPPLSFCRIHKRDATANANRAFGLVLGFVLQDGVRFQILSGRG